MKNKIDSTIDKLIAFFSNLYNGVPSGYLVIWTRQNKASKFFNIIDTHKAAEYALSQAKEYDVYFSVGLQRSALINGRGSSFTTSAIPGLWMDIDIKGNNHVNTKLPESIEAALELINSFPFKPTYIVSTGGGLHCYWLYNKVQSLNDKLTKNRNIALSPGFQSAFIRFASEFGYKLDNTSDFARLLRVPYTSNHKNENPEPVEIIEANIDILYNLEDFYPFVNKYFWSNSICNKKAYQSNGKAVEYTLVDFKKVWYGCPWFKHCKSAAESLSYMEWLMMLTVAVRCIKGIKLSHIFSRSYDNYTYEETEKKIDQALRLNPVTCSYINSNFVYYDEDGNCNSFCSSCNNQGHVRSPITLGHKRTKIMNRAV